MNLERSILSNMAGDIIIKIAFLQFQHAFFWHIPMITVFAAPIWPRPFDGNEED